MRNTKLAIYFLNFYQYFVLYLNFVNKRNYDEYNEMQFFLKRRLLDRNCKFNGT